MKLCTKCKTHEAPKYHLWCKLCRSVNLKLWRKQKPWKERYISIETVLKMLNEKPTETVIEILKQRITKPLSKGIQK